MLKQWTEKWKIHQSIGGFVYIKLNKLANTIFFTKLNKKQQTCKDAALNTSLMRREKNILISLWQILKILPWTWKKMGLGDNSYKNKY